MPSRDANGNWVYSQAEKEHLDFTGESHIGYVEGGRYTCIDTITIPLSINKSNTHNIYSIQKLQIDFTIPLGINSYNFSDSAINKPEAQTRNNQTKSQEAAQKSSNPTQYEAKAKSISEKIGEFLMSLAKANMDGNVNTGKLLIGGSQALADKVIPHSWAESSKTPALIADLIVTSEFFTGTGPESRVFGSEMRSTQSLMDSHLTHVAYNKYINLSDNITKQYTTPISIGFNPLESHDSGPFIEGFYDYYNSSPYANGRSLNYNSAQFVGSAKYQFNINGDSIEVTITNTTNIRSAFLHLPGLGAPQRSETPFGILGNVSQAYKYKISKDDLKKRASESLSNLVKRNNNR